MPPTKPQRPKLFERVLVHVEAEELSRAEAEVAMRSKSTLLDRAFSGVEEQDEKIGRGGARHCFLRLRIPVSLESRELVEKHEVLEDEVDPEYILLQFKNDRQRTVVARTVVAAEVEVVRAARKPPRNRNPSKAQTFCCSKASMGRLAKDVFAEVQRGRRPDVDLEEQPELHLAGGALSLLQAGLKDKSFLVGPL